MQATFTSALPTALQPASDPRMMASGCSVPHQKAGRMAAPTSKARESWPNCLAKPEPSANQADKVEPDVVQHLL